METVKKQQVNNSKLLQGVSKPFGAGRMMHSLHTLAGKSPGFSHFMNPEKRSKQLDRTVRVVGKHAVKVKTAMTPRIVDAMKLFSKNAGKIPLARFAAFAGGALILGSFAKKFFGGLWNTNQGSRYIPEKYSRGYDTIKQSFTDFGSKVFLSKTATKMNVTPRNSTRDGMIRTTNSICNSNLSFRLHDNAINHTRY